jgi:superfamily II DNA or RNA helicase
MSDVVLTDKFFQEAAGWEAVKLARLLVADGKVLSSNWKPPVLLGVVQSGETTYRSGLVIKSQVDIENTCSCRQSRELGTICPHAVAVGLHWIKPAAPPAAPAGIGPKRPPGAPPPSLRPAKDPVRIRRDDSADLVEVAVVLPPNLADALARGKIMTVLEGVRGTTRKPLNAWIAAGAARFGPEDHRVLDALEPACGGDTPGMVQLGLAEFAELLAGLVDHPRVTSGRNRSVNIVRDPVKWPVRAFLEANGEITVAASAAPPQTTLIVTPKRLWTLTAPAAGTLPMVLAPAALPERLATAGTRPVRIPRNAVPTFIGLEWPEIERSGAAEANFKATDFLIDAHPPKVRLELDGGLAVLNARLSFQYGARILPAGAAPSADDAWMPDPGHPRRYLTRQISAERDAAARMRQAGFQPMEGGALRLAGQERVTAFFAREYPRLTRDWSVTLEERLDRSARTTLDPVEPQFNISSSGQNWFELEVTYRTRSGESLSQAEVQELLRGNGSRRLKNGRIAVLDTASVEEFGEALRDCAPQQSAGGGVVKYRIDAAQAGFVETSLRDQGFTLTAPAAWRSGTAALRGEVRPACPPLGQLESILRPYQKEGVAWLAFLRAQNFGGVLADEMGLGKTLQTLALLGVAHGAFGVGVRSSRPSLVVCPTSVVSNWAAEAARFVPNLRVLVLEGQRRAAKFEAIPANDLVITSYALLRRDADQYQGIEFDTVVLDEAQHIKNRDSLNARTVKAVRAGRRLALTGTPLENSVLDLWSLFDFLMPGYLGPATDFKERYEVPIAKENDTAALQRLSRRLRPFMLRRRKSEVARDLPPRLENVVMCDMNERQAALYGQLLEAARREVDAAGDGAGGGQARMLALTALLRLRQVCCDPRLLPSPSGAATRADPGGKFEQFAELLEEIIDGGHRALVFSQFTSMLALLREHLDAEKVPYCYLDGSTTDRAAVVRSFQSSEAIPVFLISLKAGGVGLNLTGADTVVHFDPWWNPAVEDQATDRAHRIGQTRVVTAYKLIARGTVEEKILRLQQRKRELAASTLTGEEALAGALTWEEIRGLLD